MSGLRGMSQIAGFNRPRFESVNCDHRVFLARIVSGNVTRLWVELEHFLDNGFAILRAAGQDKQIIPYLRRPAAVRVPAQHSELSVRIGLRRLQQHVTDGFTGEMRQMDIIERRRFPLRPAGLHERRRVGHDKHVLIPRYASGSTHRRKSAASSPSALSFASRSSIAAIRSDLISK